MDINSILLSTGLSTGIFIIYKIINNYRLKSECNQNNELVISVVAPTTGNISETHTEHHTPQPSQHHDIEIKD